MFYSQICVYLLIYGVHSFISCFHLDWLFNSDTILRQPLSWWHHYLKQLLSMILKQVFSIVLDGQNQIGKELLLLSIEYHISVDNSELYGKYFCICDILTECCFYHMNFSVVVFLGFVSCCLVLILL